jgi:hypothetical protein
VGLELITLVVITTNCLISCKFNYDTIATMMARIMHFFRYSNMYDLQYLYNHYVGPSWPWSHRSWIYNYLCNQCLSPLMLWVRILIRARCTTLCDKVCQWLVTGRFIPGPPVSSTNKTDRYDITEILLKVALNTIKQTNKQNNIIILRNVQYLYNDPKICWTSYGFSHIKFNI